MQSYCLGTIGMGTPVWDEGEVDADDCDFHSTSLNRFVVIHSKLCKVPFNTPADDDPGFRPVIHQGIKFDFDFVSVV